MTLNPPANKILLHVCCAPCSGAIIEALCAAGFKPTVFWSNSNILSPQENRKRLETLLPYAARFGVNVVEDEYDHAAWRSFVSEQLRAGLAPGAPEPDLAACPERGARCLQCFKFRLLRAAAFAATHGFDCLTTSLASSRWKSLEQVNEAGQWAVSMVSGEETRLTWWNMNWRKGGLQPRRSEIIREEGFYNQSFCGCEYSLEYERNNNANK